MSFPCSEHITCIDSALPAGTALSFEGRTGTGGQLGHGNDFDYWSPHHVEWLQLTETDLSKQMHDGELAWRVQQVRARRAGQLVLRVIAR